MIGASVTLVLIATLSPQTTQTGAGPEELRFPGSGLDDVLLFVLRPIDGKFKVVAHWADS